MALTLYNHATVGDLYSDMEAVDMRMGLKVGCIRAVFLNKFVNNLLVSSVFRITMLFVELCFMILKLTGRHTSTYLFLREF